MPQVETIRPFFQAASIWCIEQGGARFQVGFGGEVALGALAGNGMAALKTRRGFVHCQCDFWRWLSGVQRSNGRWGAAPPPACFRPMASADHGSRHVLCNNNMQKP